MAVYFPGLLELDLIVHSGDCKTNSCEEKCKELAVVDFVVKLGVSFDSFAFRGLVGVGGKDALIVLL